jgi:hypothetical protein
LFGQRQQAVRLGLRQRGAQRILQHRVDEHELGVVRRGFLRQRFHVQSGRRAQDADRDAAVVAHQGQQVAVAGIFDEHDVAGARQRAQDQVEGVRRAMRQQDLLGFHRAQLGRQGMRQVLPQRREAERVAVAAQAAGRDLHRVAHRIEDGRLAVPLGRQPSGADRQRIGLAGIQVGGEGVDRGGKAGRADGGAGRRCRVVAAACDEEAGTAARGQHAQVQQAVVGFDHREGADGVDLCELSNRGHLGTDAQCAPIYHRGDRRDDLLDQAAAALAVDRQHRPGRIVPAFLGGRILLTQVAAQVVLNRCHCPLLPVRRWQLYRLCYQYGWTISPVVYMCRRYLAVYYCMMILPIGKSFGPHQGERRA